MRLVLVSNVVTPWIIKRGATPVERGGFVHGGTERLMRGGGLIRAEPQKERDGGDSFHATADGSIKQQYRAAFCVLNHTRSSYRPVIYMDSGLSLDASSEVFGALP